jgi:hypothetical protein
VVWNLKSSLDEKLSVTNEQKKVLIKEVKTLRKRVEDVNSSNDEFRAVNETLETAISELQKQLEAQKTRFETLLLEANSTSSSSIEVVAQGESEGGGGVGGDDDVTSSLVQNALKASSVAKHHKGSASLDSENDLTGDMKSLSEDAPSPHASRTSRHGSVVEPISTSILPPPPLPVDLDGNVIEWDHETREQMLQMDWLSPEQRALLQDRQKEDLPFAESDHYSFGRKRSIVQMTSNLFHLDSTSKPDKQSSVLVEGNDATPSSPNVVSSEKHEHEESKISFRRLSAMFHSSREKDAHAPNGATSGPGASANGEKSESNPSSSSPTVAMKMENSVPPSSPSPAAGHEGNNPEDDRSRRSSSAAPIPTCYRCGGTVEGPKYSTCKCDIPQMTPLVEESAIDQFKGLFSKGKNAAKKAGSVVTSSLLKGRSEENHLSSDSQHLPPASGPEATKKISNLLSLDEPIPPPTATETHSSSSPSSGAASTVAPEQVNEISSTGEGSA